MSAADARERLEAAIRLAVTRNGKCTVAGKCAACESNIASALEAGDDYARTAIDDEDLPPRLTRRRERLELLEAMCVHSGPDPVPPPGVITVAKAAELLGVSERTVQRYRRELTGKAS